MFELKQLNILILSINIVNHNLTRIVIRNNIDLLITLVKHTRLDKI